MDSKLKLGPSKIQDNDQDGAKSAGTTQNRQFLQRTSYSTQFSKAYMTDKNFNANGQHDAADFKRSVYFTDEVKIRIEKDDKFVNEFKILNNIGKGSFSKVKKVLRLLTNEQQQPGQIDDPMGQQHNFLSGGATSPANINLYAMKMMHKPVLVEQRAVRYTSEGEMEMINSLDKVYNEVELWASLAHPNIIKMFEIIDAEEHDYLYIILELADLGQLAKWDFEKELYVRNQRIIDTILIFLKENGEDIPTEETQKIEAVAKFIFFKLIQAVIYLHEEANIIHRDIKLDNILFDSYNCEVKLTDFTVSRGEIKDDTRLFDCEGTASFTAPECTVVEKGGYKPKPTDIWSLGVSIYTYVAGIVPFYGDCELQIQINTRQKELEFPETFSPLLKDLLITMLDKDPSKRPTIIELLEHPWFQPNVIENPVDDLDAENSDVKNNQAATEQNAAQQDANQNKAS